MKKWVMILITAYGLYYIWDNYLAPLQKVDISAAAINIASPVILKSGSLVPAPQLPGAYYVLYFSSSVGGPSRQAAPQMIAWYNQNSSNPRIVFVMASLDENEEQLTKTAKGFAYPWPMVLAKNLPLALQSLGGELLPKTIIADDMGRVIATSDEHRKYVGPFQPLSIAFGKKKID